MTLLRLLFVAGLSLVAEGTALAGTVENFDNQKDCSEIRLDKGEGPYSRIPVYNQTLGTQKDPDICYAVVAAQMIDAHRFVNGENLEMLTSPISVALRTRLFESKISDSMRSLSYDDSDPVTYVVGGGSIAGAIKYNQNQSVCDQRWLEKYAMVYQRSAAAKSVDEFVGSLVRTTGPINPDPSLISDALGSLERICGRNQIPLGRMDIAEATEPGGNFLEAQKALVAKIQDSSITKAEKDLAVHDFSERFSPEKKMRHFAETIFRIIEHPKSKGVGIGYLYRAIQRADKIESVGAHASIIVGRRFNRSSGKCEFLVRDSYGASCNDSNGRPRYLLSCENGSVWVGVRELMKDTMSLTWIPPERSGQGILPGDAGVRTDGIR